MSFFPSISGIPAPLLLLLGLGVGILSGLLGVGGGVLITPALHLLGMSMPMAVATSLTQMVGASFSGTIRHYRNGNVLPRLAVLYGLPGMLGVFAGKQILIRWQEQQLDHFLSVLYLVTMSYLSFTMLRKTLGRTNAQERQAKSRDFGPQWSIGASGRLVAVIPSSLAGVCIGLLSSLTGLGGGFFYIPALMTFASCSMKEAVGTSLATVFLSSLFGAVVYGAAGVSNIPAALLLMSGSIFGAQWGASAAQRLHNKKLEHLFVVLVLSALVSMILQLLSFELLADILLFGTGIGVVSYSLWCLWRIETQTD